MISRIVKAEYAFPILFLVLPLVYYPSWTVDNHPRWVFASLLFLPVLLGALYKAELRFSKHAPGVLAAFAGYFCLALISLLHSTYPGVQIIPFLNEGLALCLFLFMYAHRNTESIFKNSVKAFQAVGAILGIVGFVYFVFTNKLPELTMGSSTTLAHILLIAGTMLIAEKKLLEGKEQMTFMAILFGLSATLNRFGILCIFTYLVYAAIVYEHRMPLYRRKHLWVAVLLIASVSIALAWAETTTQTVKLTQPATSLLMRKEIYRNSIRMIKERPLFGVGPGGFAIYYPHYDKGNDVVLQDPTIVLHHAHSSLLHLISELGIVTAAAWFLFLLVVIRCCMMRRKRNKWTSNDSVAAWAAAIILIHSLVDIDMEVTAPKLFFWFSLGFLSRGEEKANAILGNRAKMLWSGFLILAASCSAAGHAAKWISERYSDGAEKLASDGKYGEALREIAEARKWQRFEPAYSFAEGCYFNRAGDYVRADAAMSHSVALGPLKQDEFMFYALNALELGDTVKVLAILDSSLSWDRENLEALQLKGNLLLGKGYLDQSMACYREILEKAPGLTAPRFQMAIVEMSRGNLRKADELLKEILEIEPDRVEARVLLGKLDSIEAAE